MRYLRGDDVGCPKLGEANEVMADSLSTTVEELTAEQKQIALLNATVAAGQRYLRGDDVGCAICDFVAKTEKEVRAHIREAHPGATERAQELTKAMRDGTMSAREVCEALTREFSERK